MTARGRPKRPRYTLWKGIQPEWLTLAHERTAYLIDPHPLSIQPFKTALANAYLQGIADAGETMKERGWRKPETPQKTAPDGLS